MGGSRFGRGGGLFGSLCLVGAALLAAGCLKPSSQPSEDAQFVAKVDGQAISNDVVTEGLRRFRREHGHLAFRSDSDLEHVRRRLLEEHIDRLLIRRAAEGLGISVDDEAVERFMLRRKANYPDRTFEEYLVEAGIPMSLLKEEIRHRLLLQEIFGREVNPRVVVDEAEVEARYAENPEAWALDEQIKASQIVVRTEEEASQLLRLLRRGEEFSRLATTHSLGPEGERGGDLGWFTRGTMPPPIDDACFNLPPGRLSEVIESPYGFHIFQVNQKRDARDRALSEVARTIANEIRLEKEHLAQRAYMDRLRGQARIEIDETALSQLR